MGHYLILIPLVFWLIPVAAYFEYGLGKQLYVSLAIMVPVLAFASYMMLRFHFEYREAYQDNTALLAKLKREGSKVMATVVDVNQSNAYINEMPVMKITIEYSYENKPYKKTIPKVVSFDSLHVITPGTTRWVWVDSRDPRIVVFP